MVLIGLCLVAAIFVLGCGVGTKAYVVECEQVSFRELCQLCDSRTGETTEFVASIPDGKTFSGRYRVSSTDDLLRRIVADEDWRFNVVEGVCIVCPKGSDAVFTNQLKESVKVRPFSMTAGDILSNGGLLDIIAMRLGWSYLVSHNGRTRDLAVEINVRKPVRLDVLLEFIAQSLDCPVRLTRDKEILVGNDAPRTLAAAKGATAPAQGTVTKQNDSAAGAEEREKQKEAGPPQR
jgi:hypothetical protein